MLWSFLLLYALQISSIILVMAMFLLPVAEYVGGGEVVYQLVIEYFCDMPVKTGEDGGLLRFPIWKVSIADKAVG